MCKTSVVKSRKSFLDIFEIDTSKIWDVFESETSRSNVKYQERFAGQIFKVILYFPVVVHSRHKIFL